AAEAGADLVGFMFYEPSPRRITIEQASAISRQLPRFVMRVGGFVNAQEDLVYRAIAECDLGLLQFYGEGKPAYWRQFGLMSMKAFRIRDEESLQTLPNYETDAWLLDSYVADKVGGTGERFNWDLAVAAQKLKRPIFLAGGLTPENVAEAVRQVRPFG